MTSALIIQTRKEVRALLPWTIGVAVSCVALAFLAVRNSGFPNFRYDQEVLFVIAYALGVLALAALSVGQEITHGTLANLLVQPLDRLRVLALKLVVLTIALTGMAVLANALFPQHYLPDRAAVRQLLIWGPVVAGIGLVPLLTVLTRRPLGGVVFAVTIPGLILVISVRAYPLLDGFQALTITWYGTVIASAVGLVALLVQFRRLEVAGDGRQRAAASAEIGRPALPLAEYHLTVRRPWIWLLIKKELRLQQMTMAVSGLYVLGATAAMVMAHRDQLYMGPTFAVLSLLHAYFVALIAGSLASAEERHIGTLSGQVLQPRNLRVQWAIKVALTIGLTLALAFGLPALMMAIHRPQDPFRMETDFMLGIGMLTAAAIYVSSLSSNTLWALLGCFPAIGVAGIIGAAGYTQARSIVYAWLPIVRWKDHPIAILHRDGGWKTYPSLWAERAAAARDLTASLNVIQISLIAAFGLLVLYFAARNHRMLDRRFSTVGSQLLALLLFAAAATTAYIALVRIGWGSLGYY